MAYGSRGTRRTTRSTRRPTTRRSPARGRTRASSSRRASTSRGRGGAAARTVRIVIEQASVNPVQRPDLLGQVAARTPRQPAFR